MPDLGARARAIDTVAEELECCDHQGAGAEEVAQWAVDALLASPDVLRELAGLVPTEPRQF